MSIITDVPWYRSCRVMLTVVTAWGYVFFYLLRIDLSLAIVCMVKEPLVPLFPVNGTTTVTHNLSSGDVYNGNGTVLTGSDTSTYWWNTSGSPDNGEDDVCVDVQAAARKKLNYEVYPCELSEMTTKKITCTR